MRDILRDLEFLYPDASYVAQADLLEMCLTVEKRRLTEWQVGFLRSCLAQHNEGWQFSQKQISKLQDMAKLVNVR